MVISLCFPASAQVQLSSGVSRSVSSLKTCDALQTLAKNGQFSIAKSTSFFTYLHFDQQVSTEFLVLKCENNTELIISEAHLIFKRNTLTESSKPTMARNVQVGDFLLYINAKNQVQNVQVIEIQRKICQGAYAPLTNSGTLIVDGFLVSSYAHVVSHAKAHASMAPLRLWYKLNSKIGKPSLIDSARTGIHGYAKILGSIYGLS